MPLLAFLMHLDAETRDPAWATVVSVLGLPADPRWGEIILGEARKEKRMRPWMASVAIPH